MTYTADDYGRAFCHGLWAPYFVPERRALLAWIYAEGRGGKFNPLNTTLVLTSLTSPSGLASTRFNSVGVQNYATFEDGVYAGLETLKRGANKDGDPYGYKPIRRRLRLIAPAAYTLDAVEDSRWGTGGLAKEVLDDIKRFGIDHYANFEIAQPGVN